MKTNRPTYSPLRGMTLIEVMLAGLAGAAVVLLSATMITKFTRETLYRRQIAARDDLIQRIRQVAQNVQAIRTSAENDTGPAEVNSCLGLVPLTQTRSQAPANCTAWTAAIAGGINWPWGTASAPPADMAGDVLPLGYPMNLYLTLPSGAAPATLQRLGGGGVAPAGPAAAAPNGEVTGWPDGAFNGQAFTPSGAACANTGANLIGNLTLLAQCPLIVQTGMIPQCGFSGGVPWVACNRPATFELRYRVTYYDGRELNNASNTAAAITRFNTIAAAFGGRIPQTVRGTILFDVDKQAPMTTTSSSSSSTTSSTTTSDPSTSSSSSDPSTSSSTTSSSSSTSSSTSGSSTTSTTGGAPPTCVICTGPIITDPSCCP